MGSDLRELFYVLGLNADDFTVERYRAPDQGVNENGRACRITHGSGNVVCMNRHKTYHANENHAAIAIANLVHGTEGTPILKLIAQYENECCDFEDGKWMAKTALQIVGGIQDSQLRCLVYGLANIVNGTPYKRPRPPREPVQNVELVSSIVKQYKQLIIETIEREFKATVKFSTSMRTSKLQSGLAHKLYGKLEVKTRSDAFRPGHVLMSASVHSRIAQLIQELGELSWTPVIYTTSGSNYSLSISQTFRIVCKNEEDYEMWAKHRV